MRQYFSFGLLLIASCVRVEAADQQNGFGRMCGHSNKWPARMNVLGQWCSSEVVRAYVFARHVFNHGVTQDFLPKICEHFEVENACCVDASRWKISISGKRYAAIISTDGANIDIVELQNDCNGFVFHKEVSSGNLYMFDRVGSFFLHVPSNQRKQQYN